MDLAPIDYLGLLFAIGIVIGAYWTGRWSVCVIAITLGLFCVAHGAARSDGDGRRATKARITHQLVGQGFPKPSKIGGGVVIWSAGSCNLRFKLRRSAGGWTPLITHGNGTTAVLTLGQLSGLLSNTVCQ